MLHSVKEENFFFLIDTALKAQKHEEKILHFHKDMYS